MFELFMLILGVFCAWGISETMNEKGLGSKIFFWAVFGFCSFSVGGSLAIAISEVWHTPLVLKAELHGFDIANMIIVTSTAGMCFLFGFEFILKIFVVSLIKNIPARKKLRPLRCNCKTSVIGK